MKITTTIIAACMCIALVNSVPLKGFQSQALDDLMTAESNEEVSPLRNKRTIGVLRQLFPEVSKMIEDKVNLVVGEVLKIFGPIVFQTILKNNNNAGGAAGGGGGAKAGASGTSVAAKNPFDDDDEFKSFVDDDDWFSKPVANNTVPKATTRKTEVIASSTTTTATTAEPEVATVAGTNEETTISELDRDANPEASENNQVVSEVDGGQAESANNEVRVQFADEVSPNDANAAAANDGELAPLDDIEATDDDNRNKRFLNFGLGSGGNGGAGGGSGGGSGNFLFDIIRQAADSAARAAGTVYRVVAGTQSLGLGLSASRDLGPAPAGSTPMMKPAAPSGASTSPGGASSSTSPPLVAGSGSSSSGGGDPAAGAPTPGPQTEAVPGPVTRLFVIANRGISNLVQDLILRLAATSERIVNFKARLITSII